MPRRPLNRILIAQRIAAPQMVISMVVALMHVAANYLLIHTAGLGFYGAAYAIGIASVNNTAAHGRLGVLLGHVGARVGASNLGRLQGRVTFGPLNPGYLETTRCHCASHARSDHGCAGAPLHWGVGLHEQQRVCHCSTGASSGGWPTRPAS